MNTLKIENHRVVGSVNDKPSKYIESPNHGGKFAAQYLVMHYTAGLNHTSTVSWFMNREAKVSAHLVIGRSGELVQMVPFNVVAWHAGPSTWVDRETGAPVESLNKCAIGIELVNVGRLARNPASGRWTSKKPLREFEDADVIVANHKHETARCGWLRYTEEQLRAAREVAALIVRTYGLRDVVGHEDICPNRKSDPGPAFPMQEFRRDVLRAAGNKNGV
jgi:N-acetylmuramoyl-L-alanine amidase